MELIPLNDALSLNLFGFETKSPLPIKPISYIESLSVEKPTNRLSVYPNACTLDAHTLGLTKVVLSTTL